MRWCAVLLWLQSLQKGLCGCNGTLLTKRAKCGSSYFKKIENIKFWYCNCLSTRTNGSYGRVAVELKLERRARQDKEIMHVTDKPI